MVNIGTFNFNQSGQLLVTDVSSGTGTSLNFNSHNETSIAGSATVTVLSYTVPVGKNLRIKHLSFGGRANGECVFEVDASNEFKFSNSAAEPTPISNFADGLLVGASSIINVKVTNCHTDLKTFWATMNGLLFDV